MAFNIALHKGKGFKYSKGFFGIIADEDTCVGFVLAGVGDINNKELEPNFYVVDKKTKRSDVYRWLTRFLEREDILLIVISKIAAEMVRDLIDEYEEVIPQIIEISDKYADVQSVSSTSLRKRLHTMDISAFEDKAKEVSAGHTLLDKLLALKIPKAEELDESQAYSVPVSVPGPSRIPLAVGAGAAGSRSTRRSVEFRDPIKINKSAKAPEVAGMATPQMISDEDYEYYQAQKVYDFEPSLAGSGWRDDVSLASIKSGQRGQYTDSKSLASSAYKGSFSSLSSTDPSVAYDQVSLRSQKASLYTNQSEKPSANSVLSQQSGKSKDTTSSKSKAKQKTTRRN